MLSRMNAEFIPKGIPRQIQRAPNYPVEDLSDEAKTASLRNGQVRWKAIIENRAFSMRQTRFVAFVEELSSSIDVGKFREVSL